MNGDAVVHMFVSADGVVAGTYEDTITYSSPGLGNSPVKRLIRVNVLAPLVAGDSVVVRLDEFVQEHSLPIRLAAGETVDILAYSAGNVGPNGAPFFRINLFDGGEWVGGGVSREGFPALAWAIPAFQAPATGLYALQIQNYDFGNGGVSDDVVVRVRPAGPMVLTNEWQRLTLFAAAGGGTVSDTLWLHNSGSSTVTWELTNTPGFVTLSATSGTLNPAGAPLAEAFRGGAERRGGQADPTLMAVGGVEIFDEAAVAPPGAVPVIVSASPGGAAAGDFLGDYLTFRIVEDDWAGELGVNVSMKVHDAAVSILAMHQYRVMDIPGVLAHRAPHHPAPGHLQGGSRHRCHHPLGRRHRGGSR